MKKKTVKIILGFISAIILIGVIIGLKILTDYVKEQNYIFDRYGASGKEDVIDFIEAQGLIIQKDSLKTYKKQIPPIFNQVYNRYNDLQISQGFDLSKYKGDRASFYRFDISEDKDKAYVIMIVSKGLIIGGSIHSDLNEGYIKPVVTKILS